MSTKKPVAGTSSGVETFGVVDVYSTGEYRIATSDLLVMLELKAEKAPKLEHGAIYEAKLHNEKEKGVRFELRNDAEVTRLDTIPEKPFAGTCVNILLCAKGGVRKILLLENKNSKYFRDLKYQVKADPKRAIDSPLLQESCVQFWRGEELDTILKLDKADGMNVLFPETVRKQFSNFFGLLEELPDRKDEILGIVKTVLSKRTPGIEENILWDLPKGSPDFKRGESAEATAVRELKEEVGRFSPGLLKRVCKSAPKPRDFFKMTGRVKQMLRIFIWNIEDEFDPRLINFSTTLGKEQEFKSAKWVTVDQFAGLIQNSPCQELLQYPC